MASNRSNRNRMHGKRSVSMALIAMLELLLLCVSVTFSWFEPAVDPTLVGSDIWTAEALHSIAEVGQGSGEIHLSRYFDNTRKAKFSPVYSEDGKEFYSIGDKDFSDATLPDGCMLMNTGEINAAALSFQFKVVCDTDCDFWIDNLTLEINDDEYSFSVGGNNAQRNPSLNGDDSTSEELATEPESQEEITSEEFSSVEEGSTEALSTEGEFSESEEPEESEESEETTAAETVTEEIITEEFVTETESPAVDESDESVGEQSQTRSTNDYAKSFYVAFHDEQCCSEGSCVVVPFQTASDDGMDVSDYVYSISNANKLFTRIASQDGTETTVTCSVWYQPTSGITIPDGSTVELDLQITSSWAETNTIRLTDETTMLGDLYPQMSTNNYHVELIHIASGTICPAVYDSESGTWLAEIPLAVEEFNVRYRSKGVGREVLATWSNMNGKYVHSFALMDEGVFLKSES